MSKNNSNRKDSKNLRLKRLEDARLEMGIALCDFFVRAAEWVNRTFAQRIKRGQSLAAFKKFLATKQWPNWLTHDRLDRFVAQASLA